MAVISYKSRFILSNNSLSKKSETVIPSPAQILKIVKIFGLDEGPFTIWSTVDCVNIQRVARPFIVKSYFLHNSNIRFEIASLIFKKITY